MKKVAKFLTIIMVFGLIVGLSGFTADNNGAGITKDFGCNVFDGYGGLVTTYESINVTNHGGNTTLVCKATDVPTPGGSAIVTSGMACNTIGGGFTTDSHNVVSPNGNATLRCQVKKSKD